MNNLHSAAAALGKKGGKSTSEAKRAAARENGKRGGRPRKDSTMYQIMEWDSGREKWIPCGPGLSGLTKENAVKHIKQLRKWAKDDNSSARYKMRQVIIVPR